MDLTDREQEAIAHVKERVREDGTHSLNACPYPMRAMCRYRRELVALAEKGLVEITKSGRVMTDADFEELADEAERGYELGGSE